MSHILVFLNGVFNSYLFSGDRSKYTIHFLLQALNLEEKVLAPSLFGQQGTEVALVITVRATGTSTE